MIETTVNTTPSYSTQPVTNGKNKKGPIVIIVIVLIAIAAAGIIVFSQSRKPQETEKVAMTTEEESSPTPTEAPVVDKETVKIQVLNGTGTPGQAGSAVTALTDAGYSADNITTDNAEDYDTAPTTIQAKDGFEAVANDIKKALSSSFDNVTVTSASLDADHDYDIIITTGGKKFEEATPTPTEDETPTPTKSTTPTLTPTPTP